MARSATQLPIPSTSPLLQAALMGTCGVLFGAVTAILFGMNPLLAFAAAGAACLMIGVTLTGDVSRVVRVGIAFILPMNADIHFFDENMRLSLSSLAVLLLYAHWLITLATNHKE